MWKKKSSNNYLHTGISNSDLFQTVDAIDYALRNLTTEAESSLQ